MLGKYVFSYDWAVDLFVDMGVCDDKVLFQKI